MRTKWVVAVVVGAHCLAVGAVILMQGCRTAQGPVSDTAPESPMLPPEVDVVETIPMAPTPPPQVSDAKSWPEQTSTYIVAKGDTLSGIAAKYDLSVAELVALNNITDPNSIRAGRPLIVTGAPVKGVSSKSAAAAAPKATAATKVTPPKPAAAPAGAVTHEVKSGDTLSEIASKYGVKSADIRKANSLTSDLIRVGWKLVIPSARQGAVSPSMPAPAAAPEAGAVPASATTVTPAAPAGAPMPDAAVEEPAVPSIPAPAAVAAPATRGNFRIHVVEEGEDLYSVAMMWGVSVARIKELNGMTESTVKTGDRLKIPVAE